MRPAAVAEARRETEPAPTICRIDEASEREVPAAPLQIQSQDVGRTGGRPHLNLPRYWQPAAVVAREFAISRRQGNRIFRSPKDGYPK